MFVPALGVFCACLASGWLTVTLSAFAGPGISIWLTNGLVMAIALASPMRRWPLWAAAAAAADGAGNAIWYHHDLGPAGLLILANVGSAIIGAGLVRRLAGSTWLLASLRSAAAVVAAALLVMPLISAVLASLALAWSYGDPPFAAWGRIFLGDATGAVIMAPTALLVLGRAAPRQRFTRAAMIEAAVLALFFAAIAVLSLGSYLPSVSLMLAPILWAALRFRAHGAVLASASLAVLACALTSADLSPFGQSSPYPQRGLEALQMFLLAVTGSALMIGAIAEENRAVLRALSRSNRELADRDRRRTLELTETQTRAERSASLLAAIGEASPELIFAKDRDGALLYANTATLAVLGVERGAGDIVSDYERNLRADEVEVIRRNDAQVLATGEPVIADETATGPDGPRIFRVAKAPLRDSAGAIFGVAGVGVDITAIVRAAEREKLLTAEIEHRARNLLAVTQSIVQLTQAGDVASLREAIARRLRALARTQAVIGSGQARGADLRTILCDELAPYREAGDTRVTLAGAPAWLDADIAQAFTLVFHELATNAAKYGALAVPTGRLAVSWEVSEPQPGMPEIALTWTETGGPAVTPPVSTGFGSTIIEVLVTADPAGRVERDWRSEGLVVRIVKPLARPAGDGS